MTSAHMLLVSYNNRLIQSYTFLIKIKINTHSLVNPLTTGASPLTNTNCLALHRVKYRVPVVAGGTVGKWLKRTDLNRTTYSFHYWSFFPDNENIWL